ncbi:hypothetical protein [Rhodococcus xishaensis]|uniref:hypothetical protein n=1 Tax=Rhodococcus xishaensis TaxID=2487364 RepID=UPI0013E3FEF0|nr:hypothetical protein [Rhodococcus xishaensis]
MTDVVGDLFDIAGRRGNGTATVRSTAIRPSVDRTGTVTPVEHRFDIVDGVLSMPGLEPGPAKLRIQLGSWVFRQDVNIPESDDAVDVIDLVEQVTELPEPLVSKAWAAATAAESSASQAESARGAAETAKVKAETAKTDAQSARQVASAAEAGAETARAGAEASQTAAADSATAAASSASAASTKADDAANSATTAQDAKAALEAARDAASASASQAASSADRAQASEALVQSVVEEGAAVVRAEVEAHADAAQAHADAAQASSEVAADERAAAEQAADDAAESARQAAEVIPAATASTLGKIKLAGDLSGTADAPTIPAVRSATPDATAGALAKRDDVGALSVGAPTATGHATTKEYVDERVDTRLTEAQVDARVDLGIADLVGQAPEALDTVYELADALTDNADTVGELTSLIGTKVASTSNTNQVYTTGDTGSDTTVSYTDGNTANTIMYRDNNGRVKVADPNNNSHAATKRYVDDKIVLTTSLPSSPSTNVLYCIPD